MIKKFALISAIAIFSFNTIAQTAKVGVVGNEENQFDEELKTDTTTSEFSPTSVSKRMSLTEALEQGLRMNAHQKSRKLQLELLEIDYDNAYESFWFPKVTLEMNTNEHLVEKLFTDNASGEGTTKTPNGYIGLVMPEYTVFNWGRDYLDYLNNIASNKRSRQHLSEQRRRLRFSIISQYFRVAMSKKILRSRSDILRHASFVYRLAREKMALKKINSQELLQAKEEYLRAIGEHREYLRIVLEEEQEMARLLGDDITTSYKITDELLFKTLATNKDEAYKFADKTNPDLMDANLSLANSNRSFKKTLKDNLPLPKVNLKLGAYKQNFSNSGVRDNYSTSEDFENKNVELVATINMTWTIFGSDGFFNSRTKEASYLNKRIAEIELLEVKRALHVKISNLVRRINFLERRVESSKNRLDNARQVFDKTLDNYISGKTAFINFKSILDSLRDAEYEYETTKLSHLEHKLELSETMGTENFPGQNFEKLVVR